LASRYKIKKLLLERPLNESNTAPSRKTQLEIRQNTGSLANKQFGQSTQIQSLEQQLLDAQVKAQEFKHKQTQILIEKNQQQQLDKQNAIIKQNKLNNISNQLKQEAAQSSQNLEQTIQSKFPDLSRENQDLFDVSVENPVLSLTTTTTIATTVITSTTVSDAIINNQKSLDQLNIETMNLFNEEIGQQKIEATRKAMMEDETEKLKDMITKQAEINKPAVHRSASQKFFEEMQLAKQKRVQELLINQGQSRIQNIVEQQQVREKDLLNQQVEMRELFNQKNKKVIDEIIEKQKEREKTEIAEQKRKQADMVSMNIRRQEKERNMCSVSESFNKGDPKSRFKLY